MDKLKIGDELSTAAFDFENRGMGYSSRKENIFRTLSTLEATLIRKGVSVSTYGAWHRKWKLFLFLCNKRRSFGMYVEYNQYTFKF